MKKTFNYEGNKKIQGNSYNPNSETIKKICQIPSNLNPDEGGKQEEKALLSLLKQLFYLFL